MEDAPPTFQEAARCSVCGSAFSTFKRRHHCRSCGKSLCNEHSSNQMALPQFGIKTPVRVCDDCFHGSKMISNGQTTSEVESSKAEVSESFARLNVSSQDSSSPREEDDAMAAPKAHAYECTCGMPLCICQVPSPAPTEAIPSIQVLTPPVISKKMPSTASGTSIGAKRTTPTRLSYGNELPSLFFSSTKSTNEGISTAKKYEHTGEGLWEAIKNGDSTAVKDLLANGVDPNYRDKQGMSLLHLAAVFNRTEIAFLLMDAGAQADAKNAQGETPLDCAPATLQYKMQQKVKSMQ